MHALHIVTGGTGFVGSAIILELLRTSSARVVALVRPGAEGAQARLRATLGEVARLYGHGDSMDADIERRCEAVAADLHEPNCGVEVRSEWAGAQLWHCAASLQFLDRHEAEIFATNVEGTGHVVALAEAAGVHTLNMVSTAYVAGTRSGVILEAPVELMAGGTNNHYERSKIIAEVKVMAAAIPRVRVLRPSIVIGHSRLCTALNFNGLYGFLRSVYKFRQLMERTQKRLSDSLDVRMIVDADAELNLIPVDIVAADAVALAAADADAGFYHLSASKPPSVRRVVELVFESVGMRAPTFVSSAESFTWLDQKFNERIDFYTAYLIGPKQFSRAHIDGQIEHSSARSFALPDDEVRRFCGWYLDHLDRLDAAKQPVVTR